MSYTTPRCAYCLEIVDTNGTMSQRWYMHRREHTLHRVHTVGYGWHSGDPVPAALFNLAPYVNDGCCAPPNNPEVCISFYEATYD